MEREFKVGDWVIGWHADYLEFKTKPWRIADIEQYSDGNIGLIPEGHPSCGTYGIDVVYAFADHYEIY